MPLQLCIVYLKIALLWNFLFWLILYTSYKRVVTRDTESKKSIETRTHHWLSYFTKSKVRVFVLRNLLNMLCIECRKSMKIFWTTSPKLQVPAWHHRIISMELAILPKIFEILQNSLKNFQKVLIRYQRSFLKYYNYVMGIKLRIMVKTASKKLS